MRPITKLTICVLTAAAMAAPGQALAANFLKIGDVKSKSASGSDKSQLIEIMSWSWGATQASSGVQVAAGDVNADSRPDTITSPRDSASGLPTGKRQHKPMTITKPLDRGSVTVTGSMSGCTVGAAYPDAVLQTAAARYEFKEVFITSCAMPSMSGSSSGGVPMESISFNYDKIQIVPVQDSKEVKDEWKAPGTKDN